MKFRHLSLILLIALALAGIMPLAAQTTECEAGFRLVDHALGETCIPENPQRIVAIGSEQTEAMLSLGVIPVGFATWTGQGNTPDIPRYIARAADLSQSEFLGGESEPNLELIVALNPDLILITDWMEDLYPQVSRIAPTLALSWWNAEENRTDWKSHLLTVGTLVGRPEEAEALLGTYQARTEILRSLVEMQNPPLTVSYIRFMPDEVRLYLHGSYGGSILQDVGVTRPTSQDKEGFAESISLETLQLADGDVILIAQSDPDATLYTQFSENPLWALLSGVQSGRVYEIDYTTWLGGSSAIAAHTVLDDLFRYVAGVDPAEVSPNPFLAAQDDDSESTTQTFTDDDGRIVEIPVNPQRILFADIEHAAMVTSLGYVPYAMASAREGSDFAAQLEYLGGNVGDLSSIIDIGSRQEPNLERILEIQPDLIIWWAGMPEIVAQLQLIAPTIAMNPRVNGPGGGYDGPGGPRYSKQRIYASLVGLEDELDAQIAEYEALLAEVIERHGDSLANLEWNFMDTGDDFLPHMYSPAKFPQWAYVAVMNDLGLNPSAAMVEATRNFIGYEEDYGYAQVSLEVVADYAADLLFLGRYDDLPLNEQLLTLLNTTAPGQANQIYRVDSNVWTYHVVQAEISVLRQVDEILSSGVEDVGDFGD